MTSNEHASESLDRLVREIDNSARGPRTVPVAAMGRATKISI